MGLLSASMGVNSVNTLLELTVVKPTICMHMNYLELTMLTMLVVCLSSSRIFMPGPLCSVILTTYCLIDLTTFILRIV